MTARGATLLFVLGFAWACGTPAPTGGDAGGDAATPNDASDGSSQSSCAAPDILDNASFETGFDGLTNGAGGTPEGVTRDDTLAYDGSWSVERSWVPNPNGDVGSAL